MLPPVLMSIVVVGASVGEGRGSGLVGGLVLGA